jgi:hypothetical protein
MKTILLSLTVAAALAAFAQPAGAQAGWMSLNQRQAELDRRIDMGQRHGELTRQEARHLRMEFNQIAQLEAHYRASGLSGWERADLDRRFDRLSAEIRGERHDSQYGYGYGPAAPRR